MILKIAIALITYIIIIDTITLLLFLNLQKHNKGGLK